MDYLRSLNELPRETIALGVGADNSIKGAHMIDLSRLNGHRMIVNCDLIKFAEASPDTTITLVTGDKLIVLESCDALMERILKYRATVLAQAWPDAATALGAKSALSPPAEDDND